MNSLVSINEASELIKSGLALAIAGEEAALDQLPKGRWIAGTIPYFMAAEGGLMTKSKVFVTELPRDADVSVVYYPTEQLAELTRRAPSNGFTIAIIPGMSPAHGRYAEDCRDYEDAFLKPTIGWIAGIDLANLGKQTPKVYDGKTGKRYEDGLVAAYVSLPSTQLASIDIVNIFEPDKQDTLRFTKGGFAAEECLVNGKPTRLAAYLAEKKNAEGRLPLVGDFAGAYANVSFQSIDQASGKVSFYAPVFTDVEYYLAKPVGDYATAFMQKVKSLENVKVAFSCNCILNYLYGELEGKKLGKLYGPITFGEIGYQLLNQTFAAVRID